jgi:hypothetical protein
MFLPQSERPSFAPIQYNWVIRLQFWLVMVLWSTENYRTYVGILWIVTCGVAVRFSSPALHGVGSQNIAVLGDILTVWIQTLLNTKGSH